MQIIVTLNNCDGFILFAFLEGEGEEEDGDFDPMAFYRWIFTVTGSKSAKSLSLYIF